MTDSNVSCSVAGLCILVQPGTRSQRSRSLSLDPAVGTCWGLQSHRLFTNLLVCPLAVLTLSAT